MQGFKSASVRWVFRLALQPESAHMRGSQRVEGKCTGCSIYGLEFRVWGVGFKGLQSRAYNDKYKANKALEAFLVGKLR